MDIKKRSTVIEINGVTYDARTGKVLSKKTAPSASPTPRATATAPKHSVALKKTLTQVPKSVAPAKKTLTRTPTTAQHITPRQAQKPQTLMRRVVSKPVVQKSPIKKAHAPLQRTVSGIQVAPKMSAQTIHADRAKHAQLIQKSPAVKKYAAAPILPKPKPVLAAQQKQQAAVTQPASPNTSNTNAKEQLFAKAIESATSHKAEQKTIKKTKVLKARFKKQKSVFLVAATASVLAIVGSFIALSNMSSIELKVASMRAGISANLPSYTPAGYQKDSVAHQPGRVTVSFTSGGNAQQSYEVTQESSRWDSAALEDNIASTSGTDSFRTVQQNGVTIYLYGNANAAWVSGGMLHEITGSANLSSDELVRIAMSV